MSQETHRTARIEARIAPAELAVSAHRIIEEAHLIRLSVEDQQRFAELLLDPPAPAPALEHAQGAHAKLIRKAR